MFLSIALTLFFVIDAFGHIPTYLSFLSKINKKKVHYIAIRELIFSLIIMILFQYVGDVLLTLLEITKDTVQIAGGIILFLIAIRLIFALEEDKTKGWGEGEPFIVPIATPLIAGPSILSAIMIFAQEQPDNVMVLGAIIVAWFASSLIFFFAAPIYKLVGEKVLMAVQRLMGLIVALIAVQMLLKGIIGLVHPGTL